MKILITVALQAEARPLIRHFGLKPHSSSNALTLYGNDTITLAVSGVGKVKAAVAATYLLAQPEALEEVVFVNLGIAGSIQQKRIECGTLMVIRKIVDQATGRTFYPALPVRHQAAEAVLTTFDRPVTRRMVNDRMAGLVDMEASGFYQAAATFLPPQRIGCLKIVSDFLQDEQLEQAQVSRLVADHLSTLELLLSGGEAATNRRVDILEAATCDYSKKFTSFTGQTLYDKLEPNQQAFIRAIAFTYHFTFQEFHQVVEACRDLSMWGEGDLETWWQAQSSQTILKGVQGKKERLQKLQAYMKKLRSAPKVYPKEGLPRPQKRARHLIVTERSEKKIFGMCPVASPKTVCCNLRTIDAIEHCIFGCSYCTIQTFYRDKIVFDEDFAEKLKAISLEPECFYHIGTGQSSDSLAWGNRNGILDALCQFAQDHPHILLEFKTKSNNIRYFLERDLPKNMVCSWSLNTPTLIENEEHFTADFEQRVKAARTVADRGIPIAFHFHPMVYYQGWERDYPEAARVLIEQFDPEEVLFVSFGSVTLIKPAIQHIRKLGHPTKILQMELIPDPHGKLTYPDEIKIKLFKTMYESFAPWQKNVFIYLCMEKASIWENTLGYVYKSNEEFERAFERHTMRRKSRYGSGVG